MEEVVEIPETSLAYYMSKAYAVAANSLDKSNQVGAVLVNPRTTEEISSGVNNFPPGVVWNEDRATKRPMKYRYCEHAERWAIFEAAKQGKKVGGSHMVCPWAACCDCARAMIVSGVEVFYLHHQRMLMTPDRWKDDMNEALNMLMEAGVLIRYHNGPVTAVTPVLVNGVRWSPMDKPITEYGDTSSWAIGMDG